MAKKLEGNNLFNQDTFELTNKCCHIKPDEYMQRYVAFITMVSSEDNQHFHEGHKGSNS